jgi:hypothetical protein
MKYTPEFVSNLVEMEFRDRTAAETVKRYDTLEADPVLRRIVDRLVKSDPRYKGPSLVDQVVAVFSAGGAHTREWLAGREKQPTDELFEPLASLYGKRSMPKPAVSKASALHERRAAPSAKPAEPVSQVRPRQDWSAQALSVTEPLEPDPNDLAVHGDD